jgi:hypothetical protein
MPRKNDPLRRGKPTMLTLDHDAEQLLRTMQPNSKGLGSLCSELIRKEAERRTERPAMLETLAALRSEASDG